MREEPPNLSGLYELVTLDNTDSARRHAERLAEAGADEGTLVWARRQTEGEGRGGNFWISGFRNLHCALVIRPEHDFATCCQLGPLACVCTAMALSQQAEPLEEIRFRWPNDVLLNRGKVAGVTLSGKLKDERSVDWLVVGVNVNVYSHPDDLEFTTASMRGEGFESHDRVRLLEGFSREFLSWANRWANDGFEPVRRAWQARGDWRDEDQRIRLGENELKGRFAGLETDGSLRLLTDRDVCHTLTLTDFFGPDFTR